MLSKLEAGKTIHLIGIGGVSMSALANTFLEKNFKIQGSDRKKTSVTQSLENKGVKIYYNHEAGNISNADYIVYTGAVSLENPELQEAKKNNLPILKRTELMNCLLSEHKINIAISGTHGKTTTSSMVTCILENAKKSPDFIIGATIQPFNTTHRVNGSDFLVLEACEYQDSFHDFEPDLIVVSNIELDHVDYFSDLDQVYNSFSKFISKLKKGGKALVNLDDEIASKLIKEKTADILSFAVDKNADYQAKNIKINSDKSQEFDLYYKGEKEITMKLSVPGIKNIYNALAASAVSHLAGLSFKEIENGLSNFKNALRRFEEIKKTKNSIVISDYAHHPSEIRSTILAAKSFYEGEIIVIFQPHTFSRTKILLDDLSNSFEGINKLYIADIDPIRELDNGDINSIMLVDKILANTNIDCEYIKEVENTEKIINQNIDKPCMIIAMGAGEIDRVVRNMK